MTTKRRKHEPVSRLWGLWIPDGGVDGQGAWMGTSDGTADAIMAFPSLKDAKENASYYADDFPGCYVAVMCGTSRKGPPSGPTRRSKT